MSVSHMQMSHNNIHQNQGETSQLSIPWDPPCSRHLNSFPIFFSCFVLWTLYCMVVALGGYGWYLLDMDGIWNSVDAV